MSKRLVQILGDGIEELFYFPSDVTDKDIQECYIRYINREEDYDDFEDYLSEYNPQMDAERVFVDEIYV